MQAAGVITAFIFMFGISGVGLNHKTSGSERSFLSECAEEKRECAERQVTRIGELIAVKEYLAADNMLKDLDRQFLEQPEFIYEISEASKRGLSEYRIALDQKLGRVDAIINKDTFTIDGVVTGKSQQEGSGGFWGFMVTTSDGDQYAFMCSATSGPYFRIHGADIDSVNGYEKLQDVYNRVTLVIPNHQFKYVNQICEKKACNGICPTAILMHP
ncbi:MAG: hypothetical protein AB1547_06555 [Thermodesulfobacteriota bacterium]